KSAVPARKVASTPVAPKEKPAKAPKAEASVATVPVPISVAPPTKSLFSLDESDTEDEDAKPALPDVKPENIPIHVHAGPRLAPVLRAVPSHDDQPSNVDYELPPLTLLNDPEPFPVADHEQKLREVAQLLEKAFLDYGVNVKVVGIHTGPVITQ